MLQGKDTREAQLNLSAAFHRYPRWNPAIGFAIVSSGRGWPAKWGRPSIPAAGVHVGLAPQASAPEAGQSWIHRLEYHGYTM